jgi:hypothetical protein
VHYRAGCAKNGVGGGEGETCEHLPLHLSRALGRSHCPRPHPRPHWSSTRRARHHAGPCASRHHLEMGRVGDGCVRASEVEFARDLACVRPLTREHACSKPRAQPAAQVQGPWHTTSVITTTKHQCIPDVAINAAVVHALPAAPPPPDAVEAPSPGRPWDMALSFLASSARRVTTSGLAQ